MKRKMTRRNENDGKENELSPLEIMRGCARKTTLSTFSTSSPVSTHTTELHTQSLFRTSSQLSHLLPNHDFPLILCLSLSLSFPHTKPRRDRWLRANPQRSRWRWRWRLLRAEKPTHKPGIEDDISIIRWCGDAATIGCVPKNSHRARRIRKRLIIRLRVDPRQKDDDDDGDYKKIYKIIL